MLEFVRFQVLYTTQLTQKRKKWHDGQCVFSYKHGKKKLFDDGGRLLAEELWNPTRSEQPEPGSTVEFERFLVELDSLLRAQDVVKTAMSHSRPSEGKSRDSRPTSPIQVILPNMGPSLSEIIPEIGRMKPLSIYERDAEVTVKRRRKYAPWGAEESNELPVEGWNFHVSQKEAAEKESDTGETAHSAGHSDSDSVSDSDSDVSIVDCGPASHKSLFEDLPADIPQEGPWTKEAYLLFSWHPPIVKREAP